MVLGPCGVCGIVPRQFWLFRGTPFWSTRLSPDRVCLSCEGWARRLGLQTSAVAPDTSGMAKGCKSKRPAKVRIKRI